MGCLDKEALLASALVSTFGLIFCYSLLAQFPATLESKGVQVSLHRNDIQAASGPLFQCCLDSLCKADKFPNVGSLWSDPSAFHMPCGVPV